jgi:hypothetical protein
VPKVDWFPFVAALISALAGLALWTYQRYVGLRSGSMAFIAESIDSRNHVIVAVSVTVGLVAALLHFGLLDMLVGLVVALLILWSALELAIDLVRSSGKEPVNRSHYGFWLQDAYEHFRNRHLRDLMLNMVECQEIQSREELVDCARRAFDYRENRWMKLIGLDRQFVDVLGIEQVLRDLFSRGWLADQETLIITNEGKEYLNKHKRHDWINGKRRNKHGDSNLSTWPHI